METYTLLHTQTDRMATTQPLSGTLTMETVHACKEQLSSALFDVKAPLLALLVKSTSLDHRRGKRWNVDGIWEALRKGTKSAS